MQLVWPSPKLQFSNSGPKRNLLDPAELEAKLTQYNAISAAGNSLSRPTPFNLMFATSIGPAGLVPA